MPKTKRKQGKRKKLMNLLAVATVMVLLFAGFYHFYMRYEPALGYGEAEWTAESAFDSDAIASIVLDENQSSVKIAQLADLHLWIGNFFSDRKTVNYIDKMLGAEKPDICVVAGDAALTPLNEIALKYLCDFMEERQQYWAFVFGNHDSEYGISNYRISKMLLSYKYCLFSVGPKNIGGSGNYFINVEKSSGEVVYALAMMDSGMYGGNNITGEYGSFSGLQVSWYEWTLGNIIKETENGVAVLQSMAFFHIPIAQFKDLQQSGNYQGGIRKDISHQSKETGFFAAAKHLGSTKAIFVGHDHINDMRGYYDGIFLCYGRTSGYSSYPAYSGNSLFIKLFGKENDVRYNADLFEGGRGFTMIEIADLDLNSPKYGSFTVTDLLHKDMA